MAGEMQEMAHESFNLSNGRKETRLAVSIGGFSFGIWCASDVSVVVDPEHEPFLLATSVRSACDFELDISLADGFGLPNEEPSFVSGGVWSAYMGDSGTRFYFSSPAVGTAPYKAAWFDPAFERGHVVLNRSVVPSHSSVFPLEYPLDELLMIHRLALGDGIEVHALGLADEDGSGYLFLGHSGAGKSTTARLWMAQPGVKLLSDDRIILRKHDDQYWMYGTPWHGDAGVASPGRAPLSAIFLLEQAPVNELAPVSAVTAGAEMFARAFVPHYLESGIHFSLDFLEQITRAVPCFVLRFTPTPEAVETVRYACV
jgi:hypothetical protein